MEGAPLDDDGARLLARVNSLLRRAGFINKTFPTLESLCANASSFLVAIFESVFSCTLPSVQRRPADAPAPRDAYAANAAAVIAALADLLPPRVAIPASVTGQAVAAGELASIAFLVSILDDAALVLGGGSGGGARLSAVRGAPLTPAARDALGALGESHVASAASAADTVRAVASPLREGGAAGTPAEAAENEHWLGAAAAAAAAAEAEPEAAAAPEPEAAPASPAPAPASPPPAPAPAAASPAPAAAPAGADIWSRATPDKLRERAAVRTALLGGSSGSVGGGGSGGGGSSASSVASRTSSLSGTRQRPAAAAAAPPPVPAAAPSPRRSSMRSTASSGGGSSAAPSPLAGASLPRSGPSSTGGGAPLVQAPRSPAAPPPPPPPASRAAGADRQSLAGTERSTNSSLAADVKAADERRAAAVAAMSVRRRLGVIKRMAHQNEAELAQISAMTAAAVRAREAAARVSSEKELRAAQLRAAAARHERKVVTLRAAGCVENLMRATLSMRIARSSRQQAASAAMLRTLAAQARLGAAEDLRAAAASRSAMLLNAQGRVAWLNHTARLMNEAVLEETAKQVEQRRVATLSQRDALERALRELRVEEERVVQKMLVEQAHAEDAFLAARVEPVARAAEAREGEAAVRGFVADGTDTDRDAAKVRTLSRVAAGLAAGEGRRAVLNRLAAGAMGRGASEAGQGEAEALALTAQAQELAAE